MRYLIIINGENYLCYQDKIIFFDTEKEAKNLINNFKLINIGYDVSFDIITSEVDNNSHINYNNVPIL